MVESLAGGGEGWVVEDGGGGRWGGGGEAGAIPNVLRTVSSPE